MKVLPVLFSQAGVAVAGILYFGDPATLQRLVCIALILGGVIGLRLLDG